MGSYSPSGRKRSRSLSDTLAEAEHEHLLDCPSADVFIRCGSLLLDVILCFLLVSGLQQLSNAMIQLAPKVLAEGEGFLTPAKIQNAVQYMEIVLKMSFAYVQFVWFVVAFGGTPANLLLGMRVVDVDSGERLSVPRSALRTICT